MFAMAFKAKKKQSVIKKGLRGYFTAKDIKIHALPMPLLLLRKFVLFFVSADLVPQPGIEPGPPALGVWSLYHWPARKVPRKVVHVYNFVNNRYCFLDTSQIFSSTRVCCLIVFLYFPSF